MSDGNPFSPSRRPQRITDVLDALRPRDRGLTGGVGLVVDGFIGDDWRWTLSGNYDRVETDTVSGRGFDAAGRSRPAWTPMTRPPTRSAS